MWVSFAELKILLVFFKLYNYQTKSKIIDSDSLCYSSTHACLPMFCLLIKYSWMLFWFLKYSIETAIFGSVHDYIQSLNKRTNMPPNSI